MPYEYRKLSREEQEEVVEDRKMRAYPLHGPPHPFRATGSYLITAANFEHACIMGSPERRAEFQLVLLDCLKEVGAEIVGWVILPNHYHVLVSVEAFDQLSTAIQRIHGLTARKWNLEDGLSGKRKVWYRFADRAMRDEFHLNQSLNYIHLNPLKHKVVEDVYEWPWSSVFMYLEGNGREWIERRCVEYAPGGEFGEGWDEGE